MPQQVWAGRRRFDHSTIGSQIATHHGNTCLGLKRLGKSPDDFPVPALGLCNILPNRMSIGCERIPMQDPASPTLLEQQELHRHNRNPPSDVCPKAECRPGMAELIQDDPNRQERGTPTRLAMASR